MNPVLPGTSDTTPFTSTIHSLGSSSAHRVSVLGGLLRLVRRVHEFLGGALGATRQRRLRVTETVSLGEKRFVSIVSVDGVEYLVGGGTSTVSLLTALPKAVSPHQAPFSQAVTHAWLVEEQA